VKHRFLNDERGFLHIFLLCIMTIFLVVIFGMMMATFAGAEKEASTTYSWLIEAGDYAAHTAVMNGMTTANDENAPYVEQYFNTAFSNITQNTVSWTLTSFTPSGQGYQIAISAPVFVGSFPLIGQQNINVPMSYFAEL